nr:DUF2892 domain-containing protein [Desulfobulbaceae bacterium]
MKKNVGTIDMAIRLIVFACLVYIGYFDNPVVSAGTSKTIIKVLAFAPLLTGLLRFCPLYAVIGLNTCCECSNKKK